MRTEDVYVQAMEYIVSHSKTIIAQKGQVTIGVPGGRSVAPIFDLLATQQLEWNKMHWFILDERLVPPTSGQSNYKIFKEHLQDIVPVPSRTVHPFVYNPAAADKGVGAFNETLFSFGGYCDIILVSAGEDGHIAGLFPNHTIKCKTSEAFIFFDAPKDPPHRMTVPRKTILHAQVGILLFIGEHKRVAYNTFKSEDTTIEHCPAKLVQYIPHSYILTDLENN